MKFFIEKDGAEIRIWASADGGEERALLLGTGLNLPDARRAAQGALQKAQRQLEQLRARDIGAVTL